MMNGPPCDKAVEYAIRVLLRRAGDDPNREGLLETPSRVMRAYAEWFSGYRVDPEALLSKTFTETEGYDEMVVVEGMRFASHCEHHVVPIIGHATVAYIPDSRIVGLSKLARVVEAFARRLQVQERMTRQIADTIQNVLRPRGVGVVLRAEHLCMTTRGVRREESITTTSALLGVFRDDPAVRSEFLALARAKMD